MKDRLGFEKERDEQLYKFIISRPIPDRLLERLADTPVVNDKSLHRQASHRRVGTGRLTKDEFKVLFLISEGLDRKEIAKILNKSQETVKSQTASVLQVFNARNTAQAVARAIRWGVLPA